MKKDFFYLLCAVSLAGCLEATTTEGEAEKLGEIWGYVCDIDSREGISNALVLLIFLVGQTRRVFTDSMTWLPVTIRSRFNPIGMMGSVVRS